MVEKRELLVYRLEGRREREERKGGGEGGLMSLIRLTLQKPDMSAVPKKLTYIRKLSSFLP